MKKFLVLCALVLSFSGQEAFAAQFTAITKLKNARLEKFSKTLSTTLADEILFGDASMVTAFSFKRNANEQNLATLKQLNVAKHGVWANDGETTSLETRTSAKAIIDEMLTDGGSRSFSEITGWFESDEQRKAYYDGRYAMIMGLVAATDNFSDSSIIVYASGHSNEDGTWWILNLLDTKNQQILSFQIGSHGT